MKTASMQGQRMNRTRVLFLAAALFLAFLIAYNIVHANPYLWLGILLFFLVLGIGRSNILGLYLIAGSIFFADWLAALNIIPSQMTLLPEILIILYLFKSLLVKPKRMNPRFLLLLVPFLVTILVSLAINAGEEHFVTILFGFRSLFRYIILFYVIQILPYPDRGIKLFIKVLLILLVIQIPVAIIKLFIYGQGETAIGTYSEAGGTYSTIFPLIGISIFFGIFFFYRRNLWSILACAGFLAFGVIGEKRGLLFFFPLIVIYLMISVPRSERFGRRAVSYVLLTILLGLGIWAPITFIDTLREDPVGYAIGYETATYGDQATGRASTAKLIFQNLSSDTMTLLFGYGPGSFHKTIWSEYTGRIRRDAGGYGILYGVSGFSWSALEFGYLGAILFLIPIFYLYVVNKRFFRRLDDPYWKAMSFGLGGIIFTSLAINLVYSDFYRLDIPAFLLFFFGGLIYKLESQGRLSPNEEPMPLAVPEGNTHPGRSSPALEHLSRGKGSHFGA